MIRNHRNIVPLAAVIAALTASSAVAAPAEQFIPRPAGGEPIETSVPMRVVQTESASGFDFGDAGIGAAAMLGLTALGAGAVAAAGHRRRHGATV